LSKIYRRKIATTIYRRGYYARGYLVAITVSAAATAAITTAAAAAAAVSAATTAAAAARALFTRASFVDRYSTATHLGSVELRDCFISILVAHLNKTEALRTARITVSYDVNRLNLPDLLEQVGQIVFRRLIRQVSNVNSFTHISPSEIG
jgi:hypothetical protein